MLYLFSLHVILLGIWQDLGGRAILIPVCVLSSFPPRASTTKLIRNPPVIGGSYKSTLSAAMSARLEGKSDAVMSRLDSTSVVSVMTMLSFITAISDTRLWSSMSDAREPPSGVLSRKAPE